MTPTLHTRRQFLRTSILGGALSWTIPAFVENTFLSLDASARDSFTRAITGKDGTILVLLQLAGGNDGLNTVVPYVDDNYYRLRPTLAIKQNKVLQLNDSLGLHPSLTGLKSLNDSGNLAIIQGVGYPNPNHSHFTSNDIWQSALTGQTRADSSGWVGRYFDSECPSSAEAVGLSVDGSPLLFNGKSKHNVLNISSAERFKFVANNKDSEDFLKEVNTSDTINSHGMHDHDDEDVAEFLERTALNSVVSSDIITKLSKSKSSTNNYPNSDLGQELQFIAQLINGDLSPRVYYASQGGYDNHGKQQGSHDKNLKDLGDSLKAFTDDLKSSGNFNKVVIMTFSEFGRKPAENGNQGTDHGTAAPMFVIGGKVKPGLYGQTPSLTDLDGRDLKHNVDFRSVYATLLSKWVGATPETILHGKFPQLDFI